MLTSDPSSEVEDQVVALREQDCRGQDWIGPEPAVPARTGSRILRRQVPDLRDRPGNQAGDPLLEDHRSPVRARAARPAGAHGRQEDRTDPRPRRPEGPRPRRGQHQPAPANPGRVRLRAPPWSTTPPVAGVDCHRRRHPARRVLRYDPTPRRRAPRPPGRTGGRCDAIVTGRPKAETSVPPAASKKTLYGHFLLERGQAGNRPGGLRDLRASWALP
jgi:hypothetical protein